MAQSDPPSARGRRVGAVTALDEERDAIVGLRGGPARCLKRGGQRDRLLAVELPDCAQLRVAGDQPRTLLQMYVGARGSDRATRAADCGNSTWVAPSALNARRCRQPRSRPPGRSRPRSPPSSCGKWAPFRPRNCRRSSSPRLATRIVAPAGTTVSTSRRSWRWSGRHGPGGRLASCDRPRGRQGRLCPGGIEPVGVRGEQPQGPEQPSCQRSSSSARHSRNASRGLCTRDSYERRRTRSRPTSCSASTTLGRTSQIASARERDNPAPSRSAAAARCSTTASALRWTWMSRSSGKSLKATLMRAGIRPAENPVAMRPPTLSRPVSS